MGDSIKQLLHKLSERTILALTLYGEARGEGYNGMYAVGCVVLNRVEQRSWYGKTVKEVCLKWYQFSCWNEADPNFQKLIMFDRFDPLFETAFMIAGDVLDNKFGDPTNGADHYLHENIEHLTGWTAKMTKTAHIGVHCFYKA